MSKTTLDKNVNQKPLVSVVIPTYNKAELLREAIASIYAQEGIGEDFEIEVIVVDDASSDNTNDVVASYPEARYIRLAENRGVAVARNTGIKASRGTYVAFLDHDDLWLPYKLKLQLPVLLTSTGSVVVYSPVLIWSGKAHVWPPRSPSGWIHREMLLEEFIHTESVLVSRDIFEKGGYFDEDIPSVWVDYAMWLRQSFHFPFKCVPGPVAIWRLSPKGTFLSAVSTGSYEEPLYRVLNTALSRLPGSLDETERLRQQMHAHAGLRLADHQYLVGDFDRMRVHLLDVLRDFPWVAQTSWGRDSIARRARLVALASESPLTITRSFCDKVGVIAAEHGFRERLASRRLLAQVWKEVAIGLATASRKDVAGAGHAACQAVLTHPAALSRTLLRIMFRAMRHPNTIEMVYPSDGSPGHPGVDNNKDMQAGT